jgi:hypothetical protein
MTTRSPSDVHTQQVARPAAQASLAHKVPANAVLDLANVFRQPPRQCTADERPTS